MLFAQSGQEAIEIYRRERAAGTPVDVAILDLTVPGGMGAVEAARILLDLDPHARLVISTGYSRSPVLANFRSYGFADLIVKPYTMEELGRAIRRVLQ
jgi:CheY-like chemotaxis protein